MWKGYNNVNDVYLLHPNYEGFWKSNLLCEPGGYLRLVSVFQHARIWIVGTCSGPTGSTSNTCCVGLHGVGGNVARIGWDCFPEAD